MLATTSRRMSRRLSGIGRSGKSRRRSAQGERDKRSSNAEKPGQGERVLRERVAYMLWVMAQTID